MSTANNLRVTENDSALGPWITIYKGSEKVFSWSWQEISETGGKALAIMLSAIAGYEVKFEKAIGAVAESPQAAGVEEGEQI